MNKEHAVCPAISSEWERNGSTSANTINGRKSKPHSSHISAAFSVNAQKFIDNKEEKAIAAGIPEDQAIKHLITNAGLPYQFRMNLAGRQFSNFNDFKVTISEMLKIQQSRPPRTFHPNFRPSQYQRPSSHPYSYQPPNARFAQNNRFGGKVPFCPHCKANNKLHRHWLSDCFSRQRTSFNRQATNRPMNANNRQPPTAASGSARGVNQMEMEVDPPMQGHQANHPN